MKPNVGELCEILSACIASSHNYSIPNTIELTNILTKYAKNSISNNQNNNNNDHNNNPSQIIDDMRKIGGAVFNLMIQQQPPQQQQSNKEKKLLRNGKHLIVSMGKHGILWIGEKSSLGKDADTQITDRISCKYIQMKEIKNLINTNGAGDSFCVGVINDILQNSSSNSSSSSSNGLTLNSIFEGMKFAEKTLTTTTSST